MNPKDIYQILLCASRYDARVLSGSNDDKKAIAVEWATTMPELTVDEGVTIVRAHYSNPATASWRLAPAHFIAAVGADAAIADLSQACGLCGQPAGSACMNINTRQPMRGTHAQRGSHLTAMPSRYERTTT